MGTFRFGRTVPPHERHPVAWYHPLVLAAAGRELLSSIDQQRNRDLRESFALPMEVIDRSARADGDFWFDFIADTGDGGNATYAVASAVSDDLVLDGDGDGDDNSNTTTRLPRGELLLFGGDLAYPSASPDQYRYRFIEMFEAARQGSGKEMVRGRQLTIAALAQNHDWMDSASTFSRYFLRGKTKPQFLGADIPQKQSYFCVKLPGDWWVFALDFALGADIDRDQYEQFESLVCGPGLPNPQGLPFKVAPADKLILIYPEPYWTRALGDGADPSWPRRYQRLEGLLGRSRIRMRLAGDLHHYMRWTSEADGMLVTCGTGGAFTHPTHTGTTTRPIRLDVRNTADAIPAEPADALCVGLDDGASSNLFKRELAYPTIEESRRRAWGNVLALLSRQPSLLGGNGLFALTLGLFYWFNAYLNSTPFIASFEPDLFFPLDQLGLGRASMLWVKAMIYSPFGLLLNVGLVAVCIVLGREARNEVPTRLPVGLRWAMTAGLGLLHAACHLAAVFLITFATQHALTQLIGGRPATALGEIARAVAVGGLIFVLGSIVGALIFGSYHALMSRLGLLTNNGYSALGIEDFKGFLRMKIDAAGDLAVHFVAIDKVPRRWRRNPAPGAMPVWLPEEPLRTRLGDRFKL